MIESLLRAFQRERDKWIRGAIAKVLMKQNTKEFPKIIDVLVESLLFDPEKWVKIKVAKLLGEENLREFPKVIEQLIFQIQNTCSEKNM